MKYHVTVPTVWKGSQDWIAEANSPEEAIAKVKANDAEFFDEEFEVSDFKIDEATAKEDIRT